MPAPATIAPEDDRPALRCLPDLCGEPDLRCRPDPRHIDVFDPLDRSEVERAERWSRSPRGRAAIERWADHHEALDGVDPARQPDRAHDQDAQDRLLAALVATCQGDDGDRGWAALMLLVQLRPGLLHLARHGPFTGPDPLARNQETVGVFYEVLLRHDLERRPSRIAANLLLDTRQRMARITPRAPSSDRYLPAAATIASCAIADTSTVSVRTALRSELADLPGVEHSRQQTAETVYRAWFLEQSHAMIAVHTGLEHRAVATRLHRVRTGLRRRLELVEPR